MQLTNLLKLYILLCIGFDTNNLFNKNFVIIDFWLLHNSSFKGGKKSPQWEA